MSDQRKVSVVSKQTGEATFAESAKTAFDRTRKGTPEVAPGSTDAHETPAASGPVDQAPEDAHETPDAAAAPLPEAGAVDSRPTRAHDDIVDSTADKGESGSPSPGPTAAALGEASRSGTDSDMEAEPRRRSGARPGSRSRTKSKRKPCKSLQDLIAYGYSRKGQRLALKPAEVDAVRENSELDEHAEKQLRELLSGDPLLAVPRQLLLTAREFPSHGAVRRRLVAFVRGALASHPVFSTDELQSAINNTPEGLAPEQFLRALAGREVATVTTVDGDRPLKPKEQRDLATNATYSAGVLMVETRGISIDALARYLYGALWEPAGRAISAGEDWLRTITEISEVAGAGAVCKGFKIQADENSVRVLKLEDRVARQEEQLAAQAARARQALVDREAEREEAVAEMETLRGQMEAAEKRARADAAHLGGDLEHLRSRVLNRAREDVRLLQSGLHALRREQPKIHVMDDHADRVLESLEKLVKEMEDME